MIDHLILLWLIREPEERKETMSTRIRMARFLSVAAILIGICASAGQPVSASGCDPAYVTQVGNAFIVAPTGEDDTANLQCALDAAAAAGPGSTVQLINGTYWTGLIEVNGFHGSLMGAGKDRTTITTVPNMYCPDGWPELITFREGDIHIADLTFDISKSHPCQPWEHPFMGIREDLAVIVAIQGQPIDPSYDWSNPVPDEASSFIENVAFRGSPVDPTAPYPWGVTMPLGIAGGSELSSSGLGRFKPMTGVHTVANCSFENSFYGIAAYGLESSSLLVGGSGSKGNTFANVAYGLWTMDNSNSAIEFSYNDVPKADYIGVLVQQSERPLFLDVPWYSPSQYLVSHNTFHTAGIADAVGVVDLAAVYGPGKRADVVVSHNRITLDDTTYGAIFGEGAQDVVVENNQISGSGLAGIYLGLGNPTTGWTLVGNNVQGVDAVVAPIWLGEGTSATTVVGGSSKANVLDEGEDNIIAGVNNMGGNPPGPEIREAMQRKLEILSRFP
jgi:hypothetical protein